MNKKQFAKILNLAWPLYKEDYTKNNRSYMCNMILQLWINESNSNWEFIESKNKIRKMINNKNTLASYLREDCGTVHEVVYIACYNWWDTYIYLLNLELEQREKK
jgi:transposase-like protein